MDIRLLELDPEEALLLAPAPGAARIKTGAVEADPDVREITDPNDPEYVEAGVDYSDPFLQLARGAVLRGRYEGARTCTGGPEPGTKNLMSVFLERYAANGAKNLGIYNCRSVRGALTTSVHGEGRAGDHGCPVGSDWMQAWADLLVAYSAELGIQCVIYNRRIWSSSYPDAWRPYTGLVPHTDHAHVEQTRDSARTLTVARIKEVLGIGGAVPGPIHPKPPNQSRPLILLGSKGAHVEDWQSYLARVYPAYRHESRVRRGQVLKVDGDFGAWTDAWTKLYQAKSGLKADGKVGPATWGKAGFR